MIKLSKRATIYMKPEIHKILKHKALETSRSISEIINDAVLHELREDQEDLNVFSERAKESCVSYESMLEELKKDGKI